jgi:hypothetical protein
VGGRRARTGSLEPSGAYGDLAAQARLVLVPAGRAEISVESPRFSYLTIDRVKGTNLGMRVGFVFE